MKPRTTPPLATWLLERLLTGTHCEPLIGDLAEEYAGGRPRLWYWRQALGALRAQLLRTLRIHGLSFTAAILAGLALTWVLERCCTIMFEPFYLNLALIKLHPWSSAALMRLAGMEANTVFWCALCFVAALAVTRVHRAHQRTVLAAFVAAQIAQRIPGIAQILTGPATDPQFAITLATQIILTATHAVLTLVAGLWAIRPKHSAALVRRLHWVTLLWVGQVLATNLIFSARRVGELSYAQPAGYLGLFVLEAMTGLYVSAVLWQSNAAAHAAHRSP